MLGTKFCLIISGALIFLACAFAHPVKAASSQSQTTTVDNSKKADTSPELTNQDIVNKIKASIKPIELKQSPADDVVIRYALPKSSLSTSLGDPKIQSKLNLVVSDKKVSQEEMSEIKNQAYKAAMMGQVEASIELYKKALDLEPNNINTLFALGALYQRLKQNGEAKAMYKKVLAIEPKHVKSINNFIVLMSEDSPLKALKELKDLEAVNPEYSPVIAQIGMLYAKMEQYQEAEIYLRRAIGVAPEVVNYRFNLAVLYDKIGAYDAAAKLYRQVIMSYNQGDSIPQSLESIKSRQEFMQLQLAKKSAGISASDAQPAAN